MKNAEFFGLLVVFCLMINVAVSAPLEDDQDILSNSETRNYGYPFYWLLRPVYEDEDDYVANGEPPFNSDKKSSGVSLVQVGAGWGR